MGEICKYHVTPSFPGLQVSGSFHVPSQLSSVLLNCLSISTTRLCNQGWEEGMLGMKKSGHRLIIVPPHLAYGAKGVPSRVPANSTLIFEVELQRVQSTDPLLLSHTFPIKRSLFMYYKLAQLNKCHF